MRFKVGQTLGLGAIAIVLVCMLMWNDAAGEAANSAALMLRSGEGDGERGEAAFRSRLRGAVQQERALRLAAVGVRAAAAAPGTGTPSAGQARAAPAWSLPTRFPVAGGGGGGGGGARPLHHTLGAIIDGVEIREHDEHFWGSTLWVREAGQFHAGTEARCALLLLHGAAFDSDTWARTTRTLSFIAQHASRTCPQGWRAVAVDLPGYGHSAALTGARSALARGEVGRAAWLSALLRFLRLRRPVLVAPSMSGRWALPLVARQPELLAGFVPVAPVGAAALRPELAMAGGGIGRRGNWRLPTLAVWGSEDTRGEPAPLLAALPWAQRLAIAGAPHPAYLPPFTRRFHAALARFLDALPAAGDTTAKR